MRVVTRARHTARSETDRTACRSEEQMATFVKIRREESSRRFPAARRSRDCHHAGGRTARCHRRVRRRVRDVPARKKYAVSSLRRSERRAKTAP